MKARQVHVPSEDTREEAVLASSSSGWLQGYLACGAITSISASVLISRTSALMTLMRRLVFGFGAC